MTAVPSGSRQDRPEPADIDRLLAHMEVHYSPQFELWPLAAEVVALRAELDDCKQGDQYLGSADPARLSDPEAAEPMDKANGPNGASLEGNDRAAGSAGQAGEVAAATAPTTEGTPTPVSESSAPVVADTGNVNVDTLEAEIIAALPRSVDDPAWESPTAAKVRDLAARAREGDRADPDLPRAIAVQAERAVAAESDRDRLQVENESLRRAMLELAPALERVGKWLQSPVYPVDEVLADLQSVSAAAERAATPEEES